MIDELVDLLPRFPGQANRCRCFLHIVNLIAKTLLKQFDVPKKGVDAALDEAEQQLLELAAGIDLEEMVTVAENGLGGDSEDKDNMEGWVDEIELLSAEESEELRERIQPVRLVLVKVCTSQVLPLTHANSLDSFESWLLRSCTRVQRSYQHGSRTWRI
jgi:hypothetical protein